MIGAFSIVFFVFFCKYIIFKKSNVSKHSLNVSLMLVDNSVRIPKFRVRILPCGHSESMIAQNSRHFAHHHVYFCWFLQQPIYTTTHAFNILDIAAPDSKQLVNISSLVVSRLLSWKDLQFVEDSLKSNIINETKGKWRWNPILTHLKSDFHQKLCLFVSVKAL